MPSKLTREIFRWAVIVVTGGAPLCLSFGLLQSLFSAKPSLPGIMVSALMLVLLSIPLLLIAYSFWVRKYEVAVEVGAAIMAIFVFGLWMNAMQRYNVVQWLVRLSDLGGANRLGSHEIFFPILSLLAVTMVGLFLPVVVARTAYRFCRKLGYRHLVTRPLSSESHAV